MNLHKELLSLRETEKRITSEIIEKLQLMEECRGYLKMGHSSLFDYLVRGLKYSESTAYQRQSCVRLSKEIPEIKTKLDSGALTLSAITSAYKHIRKKSKTEKREVLKQIEGKSSREVKKILADPAKPLTIKKTQYRDKVHLRLEVTHEQNAKIEKLKSLKSHKHDLESLMLELIEHELEKFDSTRFKPTKSKNPRQISKRLRNNVLKKANYKCQHPGCNSTEFLQVDHIVPVRMGGDQSLDNLQILCSAHNLLKG